VSVAPASVHLVTETRRALVIDMTLRVPAVNVESWIDTSVAGPSPRPPTRTASIGAPETLTPSTSTRVPLSSRPNTFARRGTRDPDAVDADVVRRRFRRRRSAEVEDGAGRARAVAGAVGQAWQDELAAGIEPLLERGRDVRARRLGIGGDGRTAGARGQRREEGERRRHAGTARRSSSSASER
jgi:hypothetical protein